MPRREREMPLVGRLATVDEERFDILARGLAQCGSRRGGLKRVTLVIALSVGLPQCDEAIADKDRSDRNRHNKKKRKENKRLVNAQTCDECPGKCALCVNGPTVPNQCSDQVNIFCNFHCSSDDDCLDSRPDFPHCVSQWVTRATGKVTTGAEQCAGIAPPSAAYCSQISPCA